LGRDKLEESGGINLYAYTCNAPIGALDPLGEYVGFGHNAIIDGAFGNRSDWPHYLSKDDRGMLKWASWLMDKYYSAPGFSYMHAMRDKTTGQSKQDAARLTGGFLEQMLYEAADDSYGGADAAALISLGKGMHTIMDSFDPLHSDYKAWGGFSGLGNIASAIGHGIGDFFLSIPAFNKFDDPEAAIQDYYDAFQLISAH
jgi:hypothetical protein